MARDHELRLGLDGTGDVDLVQLDVLDGAADRVALDLAQNRRARLALSGDLDIDDGVSRHGAKDAPKFREGRLDRH